MVEWFEMFQVKTRLDSVYEKVLLTTTLDKYHGKMLSLNTYSFLESLHKSLGLASLPIPIKYL